MPRENDNLIKVTNMDGSHIIVSKFGGQLLSWVSDNHDAFYVSKNAIFDLKSPIRGGVPICFPQFANFGNSIKHGFARQEVWIVESIQNGDNANIVLSLSHNKSTLKLFPYKFQLTLCIQFSAKTLNISLSVKNCDDKNFSFSCGLHPYFACNINNASIFGIGGDYTYNSKEYNLNPSPNGFTINKEVDYIFQQFNNVVELHSNNSKIIIKKSGFKDFVVWNPYDNNLADVDDYKNFICLEPICVDEIILKHNSLWHANAILVRDNVNII